MVDHLLVTSRLAILLKERECFNYFLDRVPCPFKGFTILLDELECGWYFLDWIPCSFKRVTMTFAHGECRVPDLMNAMSVYRGVCLYFKCLFIDFANLIFQQSVFHWLTNNK